MVSKKANTETRKWHTFTWLHLFLWFNLFFSLLELNQARLRADKWNSEQSQTDRTLRELRSQVDDLTEALSAKDGQLAVLKIRLDEADQLLKSRSAALEEAQKEKSKYAFGAKVLNRNYTKLIKNWFR